MIDILVYLLNASLREYRNQPGRLAVHPSVRGPSCPLGSANSSGWIHSILCTMFTSMSACVWYNKLWPRSICLRSFSHEFTVKLVKYGTSVRVHPQQVQFWVDSFHIWHKWSLAWEGVSQGMTIDFDLYPNRHSAVNLRQNCYDMPYFVTSALQCIQFCIDSFHIFFQIVFQTENGVVLDLSNINSTHCHLGCNFKSGTLNSLYTKVALWLAAKLLSSDYHKTSLMPIM